MDYYQQLGLSQHASDDEVRRAYRRLSKLVHPDQYAEGPSKHLAEVLMRRINEISDTLLDPNKRYLYDQEQSRPSAQNVRQRFEWRSFRSWAVGAVAAIALILCAVWFWADSVGSSFDKSGNPQVSAPSSTDSKASATSQDAVTTPSSLEERRLAARSDIDPGSKTKQ
jgi:curved DNA-binding protein CbpA